MTESNLGLWRWSAHVHQAIGMIVAQAGVDTDEAARRLIKQADATGHTVGDMAREVVERRMRFDNG